jgi:hypothetical protein
VKEALNMALGGVIVIIPIVLGGGIGLIIALMVRSVMPTFTLRRVIITTAGWIGGLIVSVPTFWLIGAVTGAIGGGITLWQIEMARRAAMDM